MWEAALKFLGPVGIAGLVLSIVLGGFLVAAKLDARHWKRQSARYEQLYRDEQAAFGATVANYRLAAAQAVEADRKNVERVKAEQDAIAKETQDAYETRLAAARAALNQRLRAGTPTANSGSATTAAVSSIPTPTCGTDEATSDPIVRAYGCAIQLDELIKWVKKQAAINVQGDNDNARTTDGANSAHN